MSETIYPANWQQVELGMLAEIILGGTPRTEVAAYWGGSIPWMSSGDVHKKVIDDVPGRISSLGLESSNARLVSSPSVAVALAGQGKTRGTAALVRTELSTNQSVALLRPIEQYLDAKYLYYNLDHRYEELRTRSMGDGRAGLSGGVLARVPIALPPIREQRRIAEILDALDAQITLAERAIEKLKLAREGLIRDLLSCGVIGNGRLRDPQVEKSGFRKTALGLLPSEWRVATCGTLSRGIVVGIVIRPTQYYRSAGVPVLRSANVRASGLDTSDVVHMSLTDHAAMAKSAVKPGDLVTVRTGYPGATAVIPKSLRSANCVDIIITRPGPEVCSEYLALWINSDLGKGQVLRAQGGLAQQHFNVSEMKSLLVAVPPLAEQAVIASRAASVDRRLANETQGLMKLTTLKKGLADDLLGGHVRVPIEVA